MGCRISDNAPTFASFFSTAMETKVEVGEGRKDLFVGTAVSSRLPLSLHSHAREEIKGGLCNPAALACVALVPAAVPCDYTSLEMGVAP